MSEQKDICDNLTRAWTVLFTFGPIYEPESRHVLFTFGPLDVLRHLIFSSIPLPRVSPDIVREGVELKFLFYKFKFNQNQKMKY